GAGLNPCPYTISSSNNGLGIPQAALFLPKPDNSRYYYLFHFTNDTLSDTRPGTLFYSVIDKESNFGLGEVMQKNIPLYNGIFREGGMTACKHANGRDWWIVLGKRGSNTYCKFLLTSDSLFGPFTQQIGPAFTGTFDVGYSKFSQDGSKYATLTGESLVLVTDFNRCTGEFSNALTIYNNTSTDPINHPASGGSALEFSPNNRFLYVANRINLTQYDLFAPNIQDSIELYKADSTDFAQLHTIQLAPDGKIYGSTWNGGLYFLHVINHPDEKGDSCEFVYGGLLTLTDNSINLPNMVNYRLGALPGSPCDTLTGLNETARALKEKILKVFPNPAGNMVTVDYGFTDWSKPGDVKLVMSDELGRIVLEQLLPKYSGFQNINVSTLAAGSYFVYLKRNGNTVASEKMMKE
ncbi:MAG: T9SS type A sorting domain-containing protein, partial [Bacteroidetes bacterium]|nr:T9SS type A sorting domain-containing protein [Bacteroidota bacterium]